MRTTTLGIALALAAAGCGGENMSARDAGARDAGASDAGVHDAGAFDGAIESDGGGPALVRSTDFAEATGEVVNPERGFFWWDDRGTGPLVLVKTQLAAQCDAAVLPASVLDGIRARLDAARAAGFRAIVRFNYADDGVLNACGLADATSIGLVESHVAQLAPVLAEHEDVIAYVEAGFFGMWGEWNSEFAPAGTALWESPGNRERLLRALLAAVPARRPIQVRRPRFRAEETALTTAELGRIGFHDDCFLASADDFGTYDGTRTVDEWKSYIAMATATVPIGGETCNDDPVYTQCAHALTEMGTLGWSYLHEGYSPEVISRWRTEGCLDEIRRRLGYRIVLRAVEAPVEIAPGQALRLRLELENVGFAPPYEVRRLRVVLRNAAGSEVVVVPEETIDARAWRPREALRLDVSGTVPPDLGTGTWELRVVLRQDVSDAPAYAMLFANDDRVRDDARRENVVAHIEVR